ncbi:MAG: 4a-hydroxytetrahydrobiopterin dehydratase [Nanoarchaeota archaeon]
MDLSKKVCVACEGRTLPISMFLIKKYLKQVKSWKIRNKHLYKEFKFKNFKESLKFVNKVGAIAEKEGHHPNIYFTWGKCNIELFTHAVKGLSENDFILAAKIDKIK